MAAATQAGTGTGRLTVELRSPDGLIWSGAADSVILPASEGSMGVLPRHAAFASGLVPGLTRIRAAGGEVAFITGAGFVEIAADQVMLLVDFAEDPRRVDVKRAQAARDRAVARLREPSETVDFARAEAALQRALVRLRHAARPEA